MYLFRLQYDTTDSERKPRHQFDVLATNAEEAHQKVLGWARGRDYPGWQRWAETMAEHGPQSVLRPQTGVLLVS